mgnify:CR=1 FL=1
MKVKIKDLGTPNELDRIHRSTNGGSYSVLTEKGSLIIRADNSHGESDAASTLKFFVQYLESKGVIEIIP